MKLKAYLHGYGEDAPTSAADFEGPLPPPPRAVVDVSDFIARADWSYAVQAPYESAHLELVIPYRKLQDLLRLGAQIEGGGLALHASGWLEIVELGPPEWTQSAVALGDEEDTLVVTARKSPSTLLRRFLGPVQAITLGTSAAHNGAVVSAHVQVQATSWLSVASRTLRLSALPELTRGSLIGQDTWASIVEEIVGSATGDLGTSLTLAWYRLAALYQVPVEAATLAGVGEPVTSPLDRPVGMERTLTPVQGFNLTQVQVPGLRVSVWGVVQATWQAAPELVELFPTWHHDKAYLIYRLKPLQPSLFVDGARYFARLRSKPTPLPAFVNVSQRAPLHSLKDPMSVSLRYTSDRGNFIEVTSPFSGVTQAAGVSCDPVALLDDIERHGLHEVTLQYPYFRATEGAEAPVRAALDEMVLYSAALYAEAHAYATGEVTTAYSPTTLHGEWAEFRAHVRGDMRVLTGYVTQVRHSVQVLPSGAVQARTIASLERVSVKGRDLMKAVEGT